MRIPLRLLRFSSSEDVIFGINFSRRISRLNESAQWQYIPPESGQRVSRFGLLNHLDLPSRPVSGEVAPYLAARQDYQSDSASTSDIRPFDVGVDGKLNLGSNFMLTMTANPDFGQVEVDQMVFNLSTIETYFPEKRSFFLEDRSLFQTPKFGDGDSRAELFYTRRIGRAPRSPDLDDDEEQIRDPLLPRIYGAAKLAGRTDGRLSVGVLQAVTSEESALVRGPDGTEYRSVAEPLSSYSILRLKQDFLKNSSVGVMGTALATADHGTAVTGGGDLQLELFEGKYNLTLLTQFSHLSEERFAWQDNFTSTALEREGATGFGGELTFWKKSGDNFVGAVGTSYRSPSLALNDIGYLDRPDIFSTFVWAQFRHLKPIGPIARIFVNANAWLFRNTDLVNLSDGGNLNGTVVFKNNWVTGFWAGYNTPACDDRETRTGGDVVFCSSGHRGGIGGWFFTDQKSMISVGIDTFAFKIEHGWAWQLSLPVTLNLTSRLQLDLIPTYQRKTGSLRWIDTEETDDGDRFLFSDQHAEFWNVTVRGTFTFTTDLTLQAFAQVLLAGVDNSTKYAPPEFDLSTINADELVEVTDVPDDYDYTFGNLNLSVVLRWEYLPGSIGYLVYTGSFGHDLEIPDFRFGRVLGDIFSQDANHTLMLKLSYLWG
jgi:hypothetical protein